MFFSIKLDCVFAGLTNDHSIKKKDRLAFFNSARRSQNLPETAVFDPYANVKSIQTSPLFLSLLSFGAHMRYGSLTHTKRIFIK